KLTHYTLIPELVVLIIRVISGLPFFNFLPMCNELVSVAIPAPFRILRGAFANKRRWWLWRRGSRRPVNLNIVRIYRKKILAKATWTQIMRNMLTKVRRNMNFGIIWILTLLFWVFHNVRLI
ncbi:unnamed protein product, partial [Prunus brigantina]